MTGLLKSNCYHCVRCSCCGLTYRQGGVHAFQSSNKKHLVFFDLMETAVIRNRALSGCLIWVICKLPVLSTIRTKSAFSEGLNYTLCVFPIIWITSKTSLHKQTLYKRAFFLLFVLFPETFFFSTFSPSVWFLHSCLVHLLDKHTGFNI